MLTARRLLAVDDGSYLYLDPAQHAAWPDFMTVFTAERRLRTVYLDQGQGVPADVAAALVADGLAFPVGGRLLEQPEVLGALAARPADVDAARRELGEPGGRGIEFGCAGGMAPALHAAGWELDAVDGSEARVAWLRGELAGAAARVHLAGIASFAVPGGYGYALAARNALAHLPAWSDLRRHLHLAALSVAPGGRYLVPLGSWAVAAGGLEVEEATVRTDPVARLDLIRLAVRRDGRIVSEEHLTRLSLEEGDWRDHIERDGEWHIASVSRDPGGVWFVLERTDATRPPLLTA